MTIQLKVEIPEPDTFEASDRDVLDLVEADQEMDRYRHQVIRCKIKAYQAYVQEAMHTLPTSQLPLADVHEAALRHAESTWVKHS